MLAAPAWAHCSSCSAVAPLAPIAPRSSALLTTGTAPRAGSIRPPSAAMTAWMTGESACKVPLARPKPAEAAALPCATVALTALAPSIRLNASRFPPVSHTATLILTLSSCALASAAWTIRFASVSVRAIGGSPSAKLRRGTTHAIVPQCRRECTHAGKNTCDLVRGGRLLRTALAPFRGYSGSAARRWGYINNSTSILLTKLSHREGHEARCIGLEAMPLDQYIGRAPSPPA